MELLDAETREHCARVCERRAEHLQSLMLLTGRSGPYASELRRAVAELLRAAAEIRDGAGTPTFPVPPGETAGVGGTGS